MAAPRDRSGSDLSESGGAWKLDLGAAKAPSKRPKRPSLRDAPQLEPTRVEAQQADAEPAADAAAPDADAGPVRSFKRARRIDSSKDGAAPATPAGAAARAPEAAKPPKLYALLDLDGTLFHMMPEGEIPGNISMLSELVVPLPDGAMRRLIEQQQAQQPQLADTAKMIDAQHIMAVRRGTRALLANLRAANVDVRVITANLLGDVAVDTLAKREDGEALECAAAAARGDLEQLAAMQPRGWSGRPPLEVTVVVDRSHGAKKLPEDIVLALQQAPTTTKVLILDDNPLAWEKRAKEHVWIVPQFDVRRPLTRTEFRDELVLLDRISDRCAAFFATAAQPAARDVHKSAAPAWANGAGAAGYAAAAPLPLAAVADKGAAAKKAPAVGNGASVSTNSSASNSSASSHASSHAPPKDGEVPRTKRLRPEVPADKAIRTFADPIRSFADAPKRPAPARPPAAKPAAHKRPGGAKDAKVDAKGESKKPAAKPAKKPPAKPTEGISTRPRRARAKRNDLDDFIVDEDELDDDEEPDLVDENENEGDGDSDAEWQREVVVCRTAKLRSKRRRRVVDDDDASDDGDEEEVIESGQVPDAAAPSAAE